MYIYPEHLKAKATMWLWQLRDLTIIGIGALFSVEPLSRFDLYIIAHRSGFVKRFFKIFSIFFENCGNPNKMPRRRVSPSARRIIQCFFFLERRRC